MSVVYFWQNTLSIHQSDFLEELSRRIEVCLIVNDRANHVRSGEGWTLPKLMNVKVLPYAEIEKQDIDWSETHVVSGLGVYKAFGFVVKQVIKGGGSLYFVTESPDLRGLKGNIRSLRAWSWLRSKAECIDGVFCIGWRAKNWIESLGSGGFPVFEFLYAGPEGVLRKDTEEIRVNKFVFIGRAERAKGIDLFLRLASDLPNFEFDVIGKCEDENVLARMSGIRNIRYRGVLSNNLLKDVIKEYDCLVLPSRHDGWGYVVNECMAAGLPCVVSDACGAEAVIQDGVNGKVFSSGDYKSLFSAVDDLLAMRFSTHRIRAIFDEAISVEVAAKYFIDCIFMESGHSPQVPWRK